LKLIIFYNYNYNIERNLKLTKKVTMIVSYLPAIFVPIVGIFLPGIAMATLFLYIEKESVE